MKTIGIIGGTGPVSSAELYMKLMDRVHKDEWPVRPHVLLDSIPLPIAVEKALLLDGSTDGFIPFLEESASTLHKAGADVVVIASNTLHVHEGRVRAVLDGTRTKFLSLREAVPAFLEQQGVKRVGLLGTSTTVSQVFREPLRQQGIEQVDLPAALQENLNRTIQRIVTGQWDEEDVRRTQDAATHLEQQGVDAIILACTDLTVLKLHSLIPIIDSVDILVDAIATELHGSKMTE